MKLTDMLVSADIGTKELKDLIRNAVESETNLKVAEVEFKFGTRLEGYSHMESNVPYFDGVHITFVKKP